MCGEINSHTDFLNFCCNKLITMSWINNKSLFCISNDEVTKNTLYMETKVVKSVV